MSGLVHASSSDASFSSTSASSAPRPERSAAADAALIQSRLKPLLPNKYHFELRSPVVFVCSRIGDLGSALFTSTTATDDKDVTLTAAESRGLMDFVRSPDSRRFITASGRKFVLCSQDGGLILVCVYEKPMTVFDAMTVVSNIKSVLGDHSPVTGVR